MTGISDVLRRFGDFFVSGWGTESWVRSGFFAERTVGAAADVLIGLFRGGVRAEMPVWGHPVAELTRGWILIWGNYAN